jgi:hypothetical protein
MLCYAPKKSVGLKYKKSYANLYQKTKKCKHERKQKRTKIIRKLPEIAWRLKI